MSVRVLVLLSVCGLLPAGRAASLDEDLFRTVRDGDVQSLNNLLHKGANANTKDADGLTPLMHAALYSSPACLKLLVAKGADINAAAADGATALMYALPDRQKFAFLIEKGANVNARLADGKTVLMIAAKQNGASDLVRALLARGADARAKDADGGTTLMYAAQAGDVEVMKLLLAKGADAKAVSGPDFGRLNFGTLADRPKSPKIRQNGFSALMGAAESRNPEAVKLLLDRGADAKATFGPGFTALIEAAPLCVPEMVRYLVDAGADVNAREYRGATPLILAAASDCTNAPESVRILLQAGADWRIKTEEGETALDFARKRGETEVVRVLRQAGAKESAAAPAADRAISDRDSSPQEIRRAVERSLALIEPSSVQFFRKAGCISCHHQSIASIAIATARQHGVAVDEKMASQILKANLAVFSPHRQQLLTASSGVPAPPIVSTYALLAMAAEKHAADRLTDALVCDLAIRQHPDGHWDGIGVRPPIASTDIESTALAMRSLQLYGPPGRREELAARVARARAWLAESKAFTLEEKTFRLLGLGWADAGAKLIQGATEALLADQRTDGSWAGLPTLSGDAYATGLALVALHQGGNLEVTNPAYRRGVAYLLNSQQEDGSWHVNSRALGFQPYFESGYPHLHDQWISSAGAGWATTALAYALEAKTVAESRVGPVR